MGIKGLYEIIGDGEVWSLPEYAARHFEQHKRPLRIAVDEACWRFKNLTPEQIRKIREDEPAANPNEKTFLWRILRLLKLNVQLLFVNDGPKRPWKRNKRGGGKLDYELTKLTHQLLRALKVPYHQAPGEAEAECARLQAEGVVDAVWSDDGDALMFGCRTLIRQHKDGKAIVKDYIRVHQADKLLEKYDLDQDGLVLFAMLAGGDYNTEGLRNCGPKNAALLSKRSVGLAKTLRNTSEAGLPVWRGMLQDSMRRYGKAIEVPVTFPEFKPLNYYRNPTVSTKEQLLDLRGVRNGWDRPMKQAELRVFLRERFNFTTREYLKHIAPVFVARRLARAESYQRVGNLELGIELKRTREKKQDGADITLPAEAKIMFSPLPVVDIDLSAQPLEEDWTKLASKEGTPYDPTQSVECKLLRCFLEHGLPDGGLKSPEARKRKRTEDKTASTSSTPSKKRKRIPAGEAIEPQEDGGEVAQTTGVSNQVTAPQKKRGRQKTQKPSQKKSQASHDLTAPNKKTDLPEEPMPVFRYPTALAKLENRLLSSGHCAENQIDLSQPSHTEQHQVESAPLLPKTYSLNAHDSHPSTSTPLVPGDTISPKTLRALRASAFQPSASSGRPNHQDHGPNKLPKSSSKAFVEHEVIDLT